jgi:hypothetical protein
MELCRGWPAVGRAPADNIMVEKGRAVRIVSCEQRRGPAKRIDFADDRRRKADSQKDRIVANAFDCLSDVYVGEQRLPAGNLR